MKLVKFRESEESITKVKIYTKIGGAKSQITFWGKNYPEYEVPKLVIIEGKVIEIVNQKDRLNSVIAKQNEKKHIKDIEQKKQNLEKAQKDFDKAALELEKAKKEI